MIYGNYLRDKYNNTALKIADAEGVPCIMEYSKGKNLRNYEIYGNSVQNGTPSPDTPIEIQTVGDLTTKNLLDYTTVSTRSGMTVAFIDNGFVYTGNYYFAFDGSFLEIGSTYVMSWNFEGDDTLTPTWRLAYEDGTYSSIVRNGVSLKIAQSVSKILVYPEMSKTTYTTTFTNIQLELGSTATEYEPYHKYDIPITVTGTRSETTHIYLDEPLRKVGDYADYIDFKNQKVIRKIAKKTYIGQSNEAWNNGSSDNHIKYIIPVPNDFSNGYGLEGTYGLSNIFVCKFANEAHTFYFTGDKSNSWRRNVFYNDTELTVDEWKSKLTEWNEIGNPLTIYYPLLTSREETISLPALKTFKGTNVMSVDTSIQPSNIKAKYIRT